MGSVQSIATAGADGLIVDIECHLSNNLPNIVIVGFANKAVDEARERIRGSFATSRIMLPHKRITVNLAPADVPKADSGFDLAIAVAILQASGQLALANGRRQAFIGELGLDGSTRAVRGVIGKLLAGRARGIRTFFVPATNLEQARLIPNIELVPVVDLRQIFDYLTGALPLRPLKTGHGRYRPPVSAPVPEIHLSEVVGQAMAKRALEIAAAGGHNLFFSGPPGTGKSLLAKTLPSVLPPLSREEVLEVTQLHSLANHDYERLITERPFRAPHHTASHAAVVGGGSRLRPGEISLSHRGVLFLDELPEFERDTLEALRQPLEDRLIRLARANQTAVYPANFILVATANPCPCGYYGSAKACKCRPWQRTLYQSRLSGPLLDRIDLYSNVQTVEYDRLLNGAADSKADDEVRQRILRARGIQLERFRTGSKLNADLSGAEIRQLARLKRPALEALNLAARQLDISARTYLKTIRVARTIADLEAAPFIETAHIAEAIQHRFTRPEEQS